MRTRGMSYILVYTLVLMFSTIPAHSGVHLWRFGEVFSSPDGKIQFIEMATCCGSAGGEIFIQGHNVVVSSHPMTPFTFPLNLDMTTANKHLLLATSGYAALPGVPAPDYIIPDNFFSINGDTISFAPYDDMVWTTPLPTDGTTSLNKDPEDINDVTFRAQNSPINLHERTGSIGSSGGPPGVPDGSGGKAPMTVSLLTPDASSLRLSYDAAGCSGAANHHIIYGQRSGLPSTPGGVFTLLGSVCGIGNASPYDWIGVPQPNDGARLIWFLIAATDASGVEGSWGKDGNGLEEQGPGTGGVSGICASVKNTANSCGHTP